ncbi:MAG: ribonuclease R [Bacilli bacterium]|nr:ribonuclease R [Bacilli bacterium]
MEQEILKLLSKKKNISLTSIEINDYLNLDTVDEYSKLEKVLEKLCQDGKIYYSEKKKRYTLIENTNFKTGRLLVNPKGYGFVVLDKSFNEDDIYIHGSNLAEARNNDIVIIEIINKNSREGKVVRVLKRDDSTLVGEVYLKDNMYYVHPDRQGYLDMLIPEDKLKGAVPGHKVLIRPITKGREFICEVLRIIGHKNDVGVDILSYVYQYEFDPIYSDKVMDEVETLPTEVMPSDIEGRVDLRDEMIFTIDGDDTKDIDDAISIKKLSPDTYELGVHIADVSHYVKKDGVIDRDAYDRGTSVYLVDRVIPMLPHKLSNGICSLNPNVDRLALSCVMNINTKGHVTSYKIFKSVIRSRKQMTYNCVNEILENGNIPEGYHEYVNDLNLMNELSNILRKKMVSHGYLEFNRPEAKILVDENCHPYKIELRSQRTGEKLIENFMIAANVTVAGYIEDMKVPGIYRVHDKPNKEKLQVFLKFLNHKGYNVKADINKFKVTDYQRLLKLFDGKDDEVMLNTMAIQTMAKAKYSDTNIGHFGIANKRYAHFTSPIRRYPDLTLHRLVKEYTENNTPQTVSYWQKKLFDIANQSSKKEQDAIDCERDVEKMKKAEYMEDHIGEIYEGVISGVCEFGVFVELENTVEGLVRIEELPGDHYLYSKELNAMLGRKNKNKFVYGDRVTVEVVKASRETSQVDFIIVKGDNIEKKEKETKEK